MHFAVCFSNQERRVIFSVQAQAGSRLTVLFDTCRRFFKTDAVTDTCICLTSYR